MKRFVHFSFFNGPTPFSTLHRYSAAASSSPNSRRNIVSSSSEKDAAKNVNVPREDPDITSGLNWGLAGKGIHVKKKAFLNLTALELRQKGAIIIDHSLSVPFLVRGHVSGNSNISRTQFNKLLKQVTLHISSISELYVHDGAISLSLKCDAKVRIISDSPSSVLPLSKLLWRTPARAVSHDSCPLIIYVASSISLNIGESLGIKGDKGFLAADIERSSLILCGKAFTDANGIRKALTALSAPIIISRGGLPLSAGLLVSSNLVMLLFAPESTLRNCSDLLVSPEDGVVISSEGVSPMYQIGNSGGQWKLPSVVILASSDSSGIIPSVSKLSPGQAAYHFLVGYQDGNFIPAYCKNPSVDPLELAKGLLSKIRENQISSFLINVNEVQMLKTGTNLVDLVQSTLKENIPPFKPKGGNLKRKYKIFLSCKFQELPKEFSF